MSQSYITKLLIDQFKSVHGSAYDYAQVNFEGNNIPVKIVCPDHGLFEQTPYAHINGQICPVCVTKQAQVKQPVETKIKVPVVDEQSVVDGVLVPKSFANTREFIRRANKAQDKAYLYTEAHYVDDDTPVTITCTAHGNFLLLPIDHVDLKIGCAKCKALMDNIVSSMLETRTIKPESAEPPTVSKELPVPVVDCLTAEYIKKSRLVYGDEHDYTYTVYFNFDTDVRVICKVHGEFYRNAKSYLNGYGCKQCLESKRREKLHTKRFTVKQIDSIQKATKIEPVADTPPKVVEKPITYRVDFVLDLPWPMLPMYLEREPRLKLDHARAYKPTESCPYRFKFLKPSFKRRYVRPKEKVQSTAIVETQQVVIEDSPVKRLTEIIKTVKDYVASSKDLPLIVHAVPEFEPTVKELKAINFNDYKRDWFAPIMEYIDHCTDRERLAGTERGILDTEIVEIENFWDIDQMYDRELCEQFITDNLRYSLMVFDKASHELAEN